MAHQIDTTSRATASYASTRREWHGLGQLMQAGASIEQWQQQAGMDYSVQRGRIRYATQRLDDAAPMGQLRTMDDKLVLFRSDTGSALGVVSDSYKVVQPKEVLEFFREWAEHGGVTIESAGVLFGGRRYFATAKLSEATSVDGGRDTVVPYALLSTSADGSLATECRWTTVRTVCNNTLTMARKGAATYKTTHRSVFRVDDAKAAIEQANEEFQTFMQTSRKLAEIRVSSERAEALTLKLIAAANEETARESARFKSIMALFNGEAKGAALETSHQTAWGWLNACTEHIDHHVRARTDENRQAAALWGAGDAIKRSAFEIAEALTV